MSNDFDKTEYDDFGSVDETYSLEEILAEYDAMRELQEEAAEPKESENAAFRSAEEIERQLPPEPRAMSLEDLVGHTVDAVMDEGREELVQKRRGLFSRRRIEDTEQLYAPAEPPKPKPTEEDLIGEEPELSEVAAETRKEYRRRTRPLAAAFLIALLTPALLLLEHYGVAVPYFSPDRTIRAAVMLACLIVQAVLCRQVPMRAIALLRRRRMTGELLVSASAVLTAIDSLLWLALPSRVDAPPYACVAAAGLFFAQWGLSCSARGDWDAMRTAALDDEPPYLVTETPTGACKQRGRVRGFYTAALRDDAPLRYQTLLLPLIFTASFVFAGLTSLGKGRGAEFFLHWSAIACAGATFALPLCWGLPWSRVARRQQKAGCAVAGWDGAARISRRRAMIVTEADLFPPGTIRLNGVKVYGEEIGKAAAYAAAVTREAGCALTRLFEDLAVGERAPREQAHDLNFYKEGGWSCTIRGETVLLGTAAFMRKKDIRIPEGVNLKTGVYLAIDGQTSAVFAVKYDAAENVDFALATTKRGRVTPILAVRDPNVTPDLLKRKFRKGVKAEYPDLSRRIALSEAGEGSGLPRALLLREGLLPYAEAVVGSRKLCAAAGRSVRFSLLGSAVGTMLVSYLMSVYAYDMVTPLALLAFLLLWTLPVLLMGTFAGRY